MIWVLDHRYGDFKGATQANLNQGTLPQVSVEDKKNPNFHVSTRYYVSQQETSNRLSFTDQKWLLGFRDVTNSASERTAIFSIIPKVGVGNNLPLLFIDNNHKDLFPLILGCLTTLVFDFVVRQKIAGLHMNFFFVKQLPVLVPSKYHQSDLDFITPRILELVYTSYDLKSFAEQLEYHGKPFSWNEDRRALLRAELDAYYAKLFGLTRDEFRYILDPQDVYGPDFPAETFRVLKEKEIKQYGEYRTRRLVLEAWDRLEGVEVGNPDDHLSQWAAVKPKQETISVAQPKPESQPAPVQTQLPATAKPPLPVTPPTKVIKEIDPPVDQPTLTDFGLYKCEVCGKMVMGFEKANHEREKHGGMSVQWKKVR